MRFKSAGFMALVFVVSAHASERSHDQLRAIESDLRDGLITKTDATLHSFRAIFAPEKLPGTYASLPYVAPRCATPILKAVRSSLGELPEETRLEVESSFRGFFPCNNNGFNFTLLSDTRPVAVHYRTTADAVAATDALGYLEDAWAYQVETLGFTPPLLDGGACGVDHRLDLYIDRNARSAYTLDVIPNPGTSWDDYATFMVIDPLIFGGNLLETTVHHEFNHACQAADDWWEVGASFEATSTIIEELVDDSINFYADTLADFNALASRPFEHNDDYETFFMYGASLQLIFYLERYAALDPTYLAEFWRGARSTARGCYCQNHLNEPDAIDSMSQILRSNVGVSYTDALIEFSRWRWFVGANDDGQHFSEGATWPNSAQVAPSIAQTISTIPSEATVLDGPFPNGVSYITIDNTTESDSLLCIDFSPITPFTAHVETLAIVDGADATWVTRDVTAGSAFGVELAGVETLVLKILHIAEPQYDPDFIPPQPASFSLSFEPGGECAALACSGDCDESGSVDFADLVSMLSLFGAAGTPGCDADGSGEISFGDLVAALGLFGPCSP